MRKFILISLLLIALAACSNDNGGSNGNEAPSESNVETSQVEGVETTGLRFDEPPTVTPTPTLVPAATLPPREHAGHVFAVSTRAIHIIEPGDTMSEIAAQYEITIEDLANANRHYNFDLILVGDKLYIPPCE